MHNPPRKITILAHGLRAGGGVSVGKNLITEITNFFPHTKFQIFIPDNLDYEKVVSHPHCEWITYTSKYGIIGRLLYDLTSLVNKVESFSPDVVLCLGNTGLSKRVAPQILLVHDTHLFYPPKHYERESFLQNLIYRLRRYNFSKDLKKTDILLCQTSTAKKRIENYYRFTRDIEIIPNAISIDTKTGDLEYKPAKIDLADNIFRLFYLTRYYPHKNIEILIELFDKYRNELDNVRLYLTIESNQHANARKILKEIQEKNLSSHIINVGPIEQSQIAGHFKNVHALLMPTTLESFSGTYLEAMHFDCPILTSDLDFAREICQDAALYFDPWSVDSIYCTLRYAMSNSEVRDNLINAGRRILEQNQRSWQKNTDQLANLIYKLM